MAESREDPEFFLPAHFLTDDVVLHSMDRKADSFRQNAVELGAGFPTEFPYEFDSSDSNSALSSPVESVVGSTETESSDGEDFFAGLNRRLAQSSLQPVHQTQKLPVPTSFAKDKPEWVMSGSPQSTLSGIGSWSCNGSPTGPSSQVPSPPTTPFGAKNDTWDLIYAAAGQVARLKMTSGGEGPTNFSNHGRGLLGPPRSPSPSQLPCVKNPTPGLCSNQSFNQFQHVRQEQVLNNPQCSAAAWGKQVKLPWSAQPHHHQQAQHHHQQIQNRGKNIAGYENGRCGGHGVNLLQSTWPPLQVQQHQNQRNNASCMLPIFRNGSNVKRESAGTGVFLPRRYTNPAPEPRKKAGCPTVLLPAKVVQALNLNFEDMNGRHTQPRFNSGLAPDHEALVARRNALLSQQRRGLRAEGPLNYEVRLPQEWTY